MRAFSTLTDLFCDGLKTDAVLLRSNESFALGYDDIGIELTHVLSFSGIVELGGDARGEKRLGDVCNTIVE